MYKKYKSTRNIFCSWEERETEKKDGKMKNFWRNEMRVNVKLRSKKLRTKWSKLFLLWNEQVVKLDENGGRKDDEWLWVSLLNGPRETGSSTVMAFWWESIRYHAKWLVNYMSLNSRSILYIMMVTWNRTRESK